MGLTVGGPQPPGLQRRHLVHKSPFMISLQGVSRDAWSEPSSSLPAFNLSQHQGLFQGVSSSNQVAKILEFQLQHQSFQ